MEILRVANQDISVDLNVDQPNTEYTIRVTDLSDMSETVSIVSSSANSTINVAFDEDHDSSYIVAFDSQVAGVNVTRPYTPILGETATEIAEYKKNELIARSIIDSIVPEGFYFKKKVIETTGVGSDYLPLWCNAKKLLKLYENNVLIFDEEDSENYEYTYGITDDQTAITQIVAERVNKLEGAALVMPSAGSDLLDVKYSYRGFAKTFDYKIVVQVGYLNVPADIQTATTLLIEDIACGKLEYYKRYVTDYRTDQFSIKIDANAFEGTGNLIVDKILEKYSKSITYLGAL